MVQPTSHFLNDINSGPFIWAYLFAMMVVALRSTATYGIGRFVHYLVERSQQPKDGWQRKAWNWAHADSTVRAQNQLRSKGLILIPFAFVTVGVQSLIMVAAGVIGVSLPRFIVAAFPGWLAWAAIYSTIGFAVWKAVLGAAAGSPWGIAVLTMVVCAIVAAIIMARHRRAVPVDVEIAGKDN